MPKVQLQSIDGDLYPMTMAECVRTGTIPLSERLTNEYFIIKDIGTGEYKKVTLVNGVFQYENYEMPVVGYRNFLAIGNSITLHGITSYWWGFWGMAATKRENDWVHQLLSRLKELNTECKEYAINVSGTFEKANIYDLQEIISRGIQNGATDFTSIDLSTIELVVVRVGENGLASQTLVENLIDSIKTNCPNAEIVITGMFWTNNTKETYLRNAAAAKECTFVQINQFDTQAYKESVGNQVYGDDGQLHTIDNGGVAAHPSDAGMAAIAGAIFDVLEKVK